MVEPTGLLNISNDCLKVTLAYLAYPIYLTVIEWRLPFHSIVKEIQMNVSRSKSLTAFRIIKYLILLIDYFLSRSGNYTL